MSLDHPQTVLSPPGWEDLTLISHRKQQQCILDVLSLTVEAADRCSASVYFSNLTQISVDPLSFSVSILYPREQSELTLHSSFFPTDFHSSLQQRMRPYGLAPPSSAFLPFSSHFPVSIYYRRLDTNLADRPSPPFPYIWCLIVNDPSGES